MSKAGIAAAIVSALLHFNADAATIFLGDQTRAPGSDITIQGITFTSGYFYGGQPASAAGSGLGSATIGPLDSVDAQWNYGAGQTTPTDILREGLSLNVGPTTTLNSVTLMPHFSASGYGDLVQMPLTLSYLINANNAATSVSYLTVADGVPVTLNLHSDFYDIYRLDLFLDSNGANDNAFYTFRQQNGTPASVFQIGFTIQSMDLTSITAVPEPGTASLVAMGLVAIGWLRRKFSC